MPKKAIDILKSFFETGDRPTQEQFADLIDSFHHKDGAALINSKSYDPTTGAVNIQFTDNSSLNFTIPTSFTISQVQNLQEELDDKVDKVDGKGLSANDFTNYFKNLLSSAGSHINDTDAHVSAQDRANWDAKVSPEAGKGLSTNDYDDDELQKVQEATDHIDDDTRHLTPESVASFTENLRAYELGEIISESQTNVHRIFESAIYKFDGLGDPEDPADDVTYPFECADFAAELAAGRWVLVLSSGEKDFSTAYTVYIDTVNGDDSNGVLGSLSKPFQTDTGAFNALPSNDGNFWKFVYLSMETVVLTNYSINRQIKYISDQPITMDISSHQQEASGYKSFWFDIPKGTIKHNGGTNPQQIDGILNSQMFVRCDRYETNNARSYFRSWSPSSEVIINTFYSRGSTGEVFTVGKIRIQNYDVQNATILRDGNEFVDLKIINLIVSGNVSIGTMSRDKALPYFPVENIIGSGSVSTGDVMILDVSKVKATSSITINLSSETYLTGISTIYFEASISLSTRAKIYDFKGRVQGKSGTAAFDCSYEISNSTILLSGSLLNGSTFSNWPAMVHKFENVLFIQDTPSNIISGYNDVVLTTIEKSGFIYTNGALIDKTINKTIIEKTKNDYQVLNGWSVHTDTQYTSAAPLSITGNSTYVNLPNNSGSKIETYKPIDIPKLYDEVAQKITGRKGDSILVGISFAVKPTTATATSVTVIPDIGGAVGEIPDYAEDQVFAKGQNVVQRFYHLFDAYTLDTWEANGAQMKIKANAAVEIYNIRYKITVITRA